MMSFNLESLAIDFLLAASDAGHGDGGSHSGHGDLLGGNLSLLVYTLIAFLLLLFLLSKYAWGPISKQLDERAEKIEGQIEEARQIKAGAEAKMKEYEAKIAVVQREIEEMKESARKQGEELRAQLRETGAKEAEELKARANKEMELEVNRARGELKDLVITLALQAAGKVASRTLSDDDHKKYAEEAVAQLGGLEAQNA